MALEAKKFIQVTREAGKGNRYFIDKETPALNAPTPAQDAPHPCIKNTTPLHHMPTNIKELEGEHKENEGKDISINKNPDLVKADSVDALTFAINVNYPTPKDLMLMSTPNVSKGFISKLMSAKIDKSIVDLIAQGYKNKGMSIGFKKYDKSKYGVEEGKVKFEKGNLTNVLGQLEKNKKVDKKSLTAQMEEAWRVGLIQYHEYDSYNFTDKERSMLKRFAAKVGVESALCVLRYVIAHWSQFGEYCKNYIGLKSFPVTPRIDILLKYAIEARQFMKDDGEESEVSDETESVQLVSNYKSAKKKEEKKATIVKDYGGSDVMTLEEMEAMENE